MSEPFIPPYQTEYRWQVDILIDEDEKGIVGAIRDMVSGRTKRYVKAYTTDADRDQKLDVLCQRLRVIIQPT